MAATPLKDQPWKAVAGQIAGLPQSITPHKQMRASLTAPALDLNSARIVWEARDQEPTFGSSFTFTSTNAGPCWVEVEAQLPDGRRAFGVTNGNIPPTGR